MMVFYAILSGYPARLLAVEKTLIFPIPQQMEVTNEWFILDESVSIVVPENSSERDIFLARFLVRELSDKYGLAIKIELLSDLPGDRKVVVMGTLDNILVRQYCISNNLDLNQKDPVPEGYVLQVSSNQIVIAGWDDP